MELFQLWERENRVSSAVGGDGTLKIAAAKLYDGHVPCAVARHTSPLTAWEWCACDVEMGDGVRGR